MCKFFSFVTEPDGHPNEKFYFNWKQRQKDFAGADSHDHIISFYKLKDGKCNSYEYNPLTKEFEVDQQNSETDDRVQAHEWVEKLNWKKIVEPLDIKPIINPLDLPKVRRVTKQHKAWLKEWASVWDSVWDSVGDSVRDSVGDSVRDSVGDSVWDSVRAYVSSFIDVKYKYDFTSGVHLWESGIVPSFDGTTWRLHSGKKADVVYEINKADLC